MWPLILLPLFTVLVLIIAWLWPPVPDEPAPVPPARSWPIREFKRPLRPPPPPAPDPKEFKELKDLKPFEFQDWVIEKMKAIPSSRKVGDMGLDGYIPKDSFREAAGIQVKKSQDIGRNVVDNFKSALERANYNKGYIVAFSFGGGALKEVARLKNTGSKTEIELVKVEDLLVLLGKFKSKMAGEVATPAPEVEPPCEKCEEIAASSPEVEPPREKCKEVAPPLPEVEPPCEKCGKPMVWRKGKWGPFLGCSGYPQCKNIRKKKNYRA